MNNFKFLIVLWISLGSSAGLFGQEKGAPSSLRTTEVNMRITHKKYLDSAKVFKKTNLEKSLDYIARSMSLITAAGNQELWAESLIALGEIYLHHGQADLAIANLQEALNIEDQNSTALLLGKAYLYNEDYTKARELFQEISERNLAVPYLEIQALEGLGDSFLGLKRYPEAIDHYKKGLQLAENNGVGPKITDLNSKIASAYDADNQIGEAQAYYENSLETSKSLPPNQAVKEKEKVADFYKRSNRIDDEIELRKESLDQIKESPSMDADIPESAVAVDSISPQSINYKLANAYVAKDDYDQAIVYLEESLQLASKEEDLEVQKDATRTLSEVYKKKGDFTRALETYQQYVTLVDTIYAKKEREIAEAAKLNIDIVNQQTRIRGLENERELAQSRYDLAIAEQNFIKESNKRQQWIIYSLILGMVLMGLLAYFFYRNTQQQKLANNLLALKSLRTQMNPHFIFNALNSVNNFIARNDERRANAYLSDFSALMRAVLEHSEADFIPLSKEIDLLTKYLKLEHSRFPEKFTYSLEVDPNLDVDAFRIPPMLLQPYLENAIWHGLRYKESEGKLTVGIHQIAGQNLKVSIADNGIGRKKSAELKTGNQLKKVSRAMRNIEKRIAILNEMYPEQLNVTITDLDMDGSGTLVVLTITKAKAS